MSVLVKYIHTKRQRENGVDVCVLITLNAGCN